MKTFSALLAICAGNSPVTGEFPTQRPVTQSFDVFFDLCLNKRLSKQCWSWWFETPSPALWRQRNEMRRGSLSQDVELRWHNNPKLPAYERLRVHFRYFVVSFLLRFPERRRIDRPEGRGMGCLLWVQCLNTKSQTARLSRWLCAAPLNLCLTTGFRLSGTLLSKLLFT